MTFISLYSPLFSPAVKMSHLSRQEKKKNGYFFSNPKQTFKILPNAVLSTEVHSLQVGPRAQVVCLGLAGKPRSRAPGFCSACPCVTWGHSLSCSGLQRPVSGTGVGWGGGEGLCITLPTSLGGWEGSRELRA